MYNSVSVRYVLIKDLKTKVKQQFIVFNKQSIILKILLLISWCKQNEQSQSPKISTIVFLKDALSLKIYESNEEEETQKLSTKKCNLNSKMEGKRGKRN